MHTTGSNPKKEYDVTERLTRLETKIETICTTLSETVRDLKQFKEDIKTDINQLKDGLVDRVTELEIRVGKIENTIVVVKNAILILLASVGTIFSFMQIVKLIVRK